MPNITVVGKAEKQLLKKLGMSTKDYGVLRRADNMVGLLCYATRDHLWIKTKSFGDGLIPGRIPDKAEQQILRENGINWERFAVTYRDAGTIQLRFFGTNICVEIWKGDRKW